MSEDFFAATAPYLSSLNKTDRSIYDYVAQNLEKVKDKSIRTLSHECFVSTATIFRFVQKLGFSGYADFINLLRLTYYASQEQSRPGSASLEGWPQEYMDSIRETFNVISEEKADIFRKRFLQARSILLLSDDKCREAAFYARRLFCMQGRPSFVLTCGYELKNAECNITREDMLLVLTRTGQEPELLEQIRRLRAGHPAFLVSFAGQKHGALQNFSDLSLYVAGGTGGRFLHGALIAAIDFLACHCQKRCGDIERH